MMELDFLKSEASACDNQSTFSKVIRMNNMLDRDISSNSTIQTQVFNGQIDGISRESKSFNPGICNVTIPHGLVGGITTSPPVVDVVRYRIC